MERAIHIAGYDADLEYQRTKLSRAIVNLSTRAPEDTMSIAQICCAPAREGLRSARSARAAELRRRAAGGPCLGGASAWRGRGAEAVASTNMAENITVTVRLRLLSSVNARVVRFVCAQYSKIFNLYEVLFQFV
jgi:hypothetical protein